MKSPYAIRCAMPLGLIAGRAAIITTVQLRTRTTRAGNTYDTVNLITWLRAEIYILFVVCMRLYTAAIAYLTLQSAIYSTERRRRPWVIPNPARKAFHNRKSRTFTNSSPSPPQQVVLIAISRWNGDAETLPGRMLQDIGVDLNKIMKKTENKHEQRYQSKGKSFLRLSRIAQQWHTERIDPD